MTSFFNFQRTSYLALTGSIVLGLTLWMPTKVHARQNTEKNHSLTPHEKEDDIFFAESERVPQNLKQDRKNRHGADEFIEDDD